MTLFDDELYLLYLKKCDMQTFMLNSHSFSIQIVGLAAGGAERKGDRIHLLRNVHLHF